jgi:hypothetical protein
MRTLRFALLTAFLFIIFYGCSKSNNNNANPTSTQWTVDDTTYKPASTFYDTAGTFPEMRSRDSLLNEIYVMFNSHPTANSTYSLVENVFDSTSTNAYASIYITLSKSNTTYVSSGIGDKLTATIVNGKLQAVFSNITISNFVNYKKASGTVIQTY